MTITLYRVITRVMPKVNVYLSDELANAVREAGIPVSPVCQRALAEAVRGVATAKATVAALRRPDFDPAVYSKIEERMSALMTPKLRWVIDRARELDPAGTVTTKHLLIGVIEQGDNLGMRILESLDVDTDALEAAAHRIEAAESGSFEGGASHDSLWNGLSFPARMALATTLETAVDRGHNYLGCEHLVLGLIEVEGSGASAVLRDLGVEASSYKRAMSSALAGAGLIREAERTSESKIDDILRRLEAIETRLGR